MKTNKKQLLITLLTVLAILALLVLMPQLRGADAPAEETLALLTGERQSSAAGSGAESGGPGETAPVTDAAERTLDKNGSYTSKEDVALYLHLYGRLPGNFLTKNEAQKLGWDSSKGNLEKVAPGKSIGGDVFGNREGLLPAKAGRTYYECDVGYAGGYRGGERIVYSNDGLIYYSSDHYASFTLLYGEP